MSTSSQHDLRDSPGRRSDELRPNRQRTLAQCPRRPRLHIALHGDVLGVVQLSVRGVEALLDQIGHLQSTDDRRLFRSPKYHVVLLRLLHGLSKEVVDQRGVVDSADGFRMATRPLNHLAHGSLRDAEGNQVAEGVVEQLEHARVLQLLRVERLSGVEVDGLCCVQLAYASGAETNQTDSVQQHHEGLPR